MDRDNASHAEITGIRGQQPTAGELLFRKRQRMNDMALAGRACRRRRVAGYVQVTFGEAAADVEQMLRMEAMRRGWHMTRVFVDPAGTLPPMQRKDWLMVRRYVHEGFADGVIVLNRRHISPDADEYLAQLTFLCGRPAFVALVVPETAA
ncbi:hypothetical protein [Streptomyces sp. NPDC057910]|uniref:hypothetical protein n=1 Tax=Streptomyces sp. NPDC057910 TaxID=3346278 RepID=UPI0036E9E01A